MDAADVQQSESPGGGTEQHLRSKEKWQNHNISFIFEQILKTNL